MKRIIIAMLAIISISILGYRINTNAVGIERKMVRYNNFETESVEDIQEENENELIEQALLQNANVIENCRITYYCTCKKCCGKSDGITRSGVIATPYVTCAVDSNIIPLGSDILIDYEDGEIHYMKADDTGYGINGSAIDICVATHEEALNLGINYATVYWIEQ